MISRDANKMNMYRVVKALCDANSNITAENAAFMVAYGLFCINFSLMEDTLELTTESTTGITTDKNMDKAILCQTVADIAGLVFAFASKTKNYTLRETVDFSYSELYKMKGSLVVATANNVYKTAIKNSQELEPYGVTLESLAELKTQTVGFRKSIAANRKAVSEKGTQTENIVDIVGDTDLILKEQMDKTVVTFRKKYPDFVTSYKKARLVMDQHATAVTVPVPVIPTPAVVGEQ